MTTIDRIRGRAGEIAGDAPKDKVPVVAPPPLAAKTEPVILETNPEITSLERASTQASTIATTEKAKLLNAVGDLNEARIRALLEE